MTINYEEVTSEMGTVTIVKTDTETNIVTLIPKDPFNSDYQRYLNPEAEQSTPIVINEAETI